MFSRRLICVLFILSIMFTTVWAAAEVETVASYNKAQELYQKGRYEDAIKQYQEFMDKYPNSQLLVAALFYTAQCYQKQDKTNQAIKYYQELIEKYKDGYWVDSAQEEIQALDKK